MITGSVIPTPDAATPFSVVVRQNGEIVRVRPAQSAQEGEQILAELLKGARTYEGLLARGGEEA